MTRSLAYSSSHANFCLPDIHPHLRFSFFSGFSDVTLHCRLDQIPVVFLFFCLSFFWVLAVTPDWCRLADAASGRRFWWWGVCADGSVSVGKCRNPLGRLSSCLHDNSTELSCCVRKRRSHERKRRAMGELHISEESPVLQTGVFWVEKKKRKIDAPWDMRWWPCVCRIFIT